MTYLEVAAQRRLGAVRPGTQNDFVEPPFPVAALDSDIGVSAVLEGTAF